MNSKVISRIILLSLFIINLVFANCGGDHGDGKAASELNVKKTKVNALVTTVTNDGNINGLVITSCGQCNLGLKGKRGCSLTIKIGESIYPVEGTGIHDHGDAHGREGFCSAIRVAWATGKIKDKVFHAESFQLVGDSR
jgi:hypothetical protein